MSQDVFVRAALRAASNTDPKCTFLLGAVIVLGHRIVASGSCRSKSHPRNPKLKSGSKRRQVCAECDSIFAASRLLNKEDFRRCHIYVARKRHNGTIGLAKPCEYCMELIRELGIKKIFYTNNSGQIEEIRN